ncbi:MAG TPA: preprotein translocase subunit SecE [Eubacteriaceae bacterium]|nr:preprotein translocase subunit SecE [Eubacteriaceae bacterium]
MMAKISKEPKKQAVKSKNKAKANRPGLFKRLKEFLRAVWMELKKVTWPSKQELMQHTSVVLGIVLIMTALVYVVDVGLGGVLSLIMR